MSRSHHLRIEEHIDTHTGAYWHDRTKAARLDVADIAATGAR